VIDHSHKMDFGNERSLMNETETVFDEVGSSFHIDQPGEPPKHVIAFSRCGNIKPCIECKFCVSVCLSTSVSTCLQVSLSSELFRRQLVVPYIYIAKKIRVFVQSEVFIQ
jgi:hypothetical protein